MSDDETRICCDVCGLRGDTGIDFFTPSETGNRCLRCNGVQNDYALLHPNESAPVGNELFKRNLTPLNQRRALYFMKKAMSFKKLNPFQYREESIHKYADEWLKSHPELSERFDMCNFIEFDRDADIINRINGIHNNNEADENSDD